MPPARTGPQVMFGGQVSQSGSAPILKHLPNHHTHRAPCRPLWFQDLEEAVSWQMTCRANAGKRKRRGISASLDPDQVNHTHTHTHTYIWTGSGTLELE